MGGSFCPGTYGFDDDVATQEGRTDTEGAREIHLVADRFQLTGSHIDNPQTHDRVFMVEPFDADIVNLLESEGDEHMVSTDIATARVDFGCDLEYVDLGGEFCTRGNRLRTLERESDDLGVVEGRPVAEHVGDELGADDVRDLIHGLRASLDGWWSSLEPAAIGQRHRLAPRATRRLLRGHLSTRFEATSMSRRNAR